MRHKQGAALRNLSSLHAPTFSPSRQIKCYHVFGTKILTDIYRYLKAFAFKVLLECRSWTSRNDEVQMFFPTPKRNMFPGKYVK